MALRTLLSARSGTFSVDALKTWPTSVEHDLRFEAPRIAMLGIGRKCQKPAPRAWRCLAEQYQDFARSLAIASP
ncbi:MAG: hypothetical protein H7345_00300 [Rubritepida sp.]|nr:hypothetical protein [Rubritepida sp.]